MLSNKQKYVKRKINDNYATYLYGVHRTGKSHLVADYIKTCQMPIVITVKTELELSFQKMGLRYLDNKLRENIQLFLIDEVGDIEYDYLWYGEEVSQYSDTQIAELSAYAKKIILIDSDFDSRWSKRAVSYEMDLEDNLALRPEFVKSEWENRV